ncbi:MAG: hypothetical protein C4292_01390 [Nitrososphaera sp.]
MDLSLLGITVDLNYVILGVISYAIGLASVMAYGRLRALAATPQKKEEEKTEEQRKDRNFHVDDAIVEAVVLEYTRRLRDYDRVMAEMKAKLDIVEVKLLHNAAVMPSQPAQPHAQAVSEPIAVTQQRLPSMISTTTAAVTTAQTTATEYVEGQNCTTDYILKLLVERPRTSREVQHAIGRTREHTARLMKKLHDSGLVSRDMNAKPFRYAITEAGRTRLGTVVAAVAARPQLVTTHEAQH